MKHKLYIVNKTAYSTRDLRKFFLAGIKEYGSEGATRIITVVYSNKNVVSGRASYTSGRMRMRIPRDPTVLNTPEKMAMFAKVFFHEIGHNLGLRHRAMMDLSLIETRFHIGRTMSYNLLHSRSI